VAQTFLTIIRRAHIVNKAWPRHIQVASEASASHAAPPSISFPEPTQSQAESESSTVTTHWHDSVPSSPSPNNQTRDESPQVIQASHKRRIIISFDDEAPPPQKKPMKKVNCKFYFILCIYQ
jgi:hypothetical protein